MRQSFIGLAGCGSPLLQPRDVKPQHVAVTVCLVLYRN